jgi:hypothetical protein
MTNVYRTSLPIARLRDMGCRVSHLLNHEPRRARWAYCITLPKGVGATEFTDIEQDEAAGVFVRVGIIEGTVIYSKTMDADSDDMRQGDRLMAERLDSAASYLAERLRVVSNPRTKVRRK